MILIRNLNQINQQLPKIALTIGNFDGVHLAHQKIINYTQQIAKSKNIKSAILSFEPHPISFLNQKNQNFNHNFRITNLAQKLKLLKSHNFDYIIIIPFNNYLSSLNANFFVEEVLINKLNVDSLVVGYDFTFGQNREGNFKTLEQYNFELHEINPIKSNNLNADITISSSLARKYIHLGEVKILPQILGRNFQVEGLVIEGNKLAQKLGFNTANFHTRYNLIRPKFGVYKTRTFIHKFNQYFDSITNFGMRPTTKNLDFKPIMAPIYETHILNFSQNIYNHKITVEFLDFLRDEKKFSSLEELQNQIKLDLNLSASIVLKFQAK